MLGLAPLHGKRCRCATSFPYALPSSYLDKDWRTNPDATGEDGKPDFPIANGYFRPFCAALLRRAVIIAAFVVAVALGL